MCNAEEDGIRRLFVDAQRVVDDGFLQELTEILQETDVGDHAARSIAAAVNNKYQAGNTVQADDLIRYVQRLVHLLRVTRRNDGPAL